MVEDMATIAEKDLPGNEDSEPASASKVPPSMDVLADTVNDVPHNTPGTPCADTANKSNVVFTKVQGLSKNGSIHAKRKSLENNATSTDEPNVSFTGDRRASLQLDQKYGSEPDQQTNRQQASPVNNIARNSVASSMENTHRSGIISQL